MVCRMCTYSYILYVEAEEEEEEEEEEEAGEDVQVECLA